MDYDICPLAHRFEPDRPRSALPGTRLCRGCNDDLERALVGADRFTGGERTRERGLPELYAELIDVLPTSSLRGGEPVAGTREAKLPFNSGVSDHRTEIRSTLLSWSRMVAEYRGEGPPRVSEPQVTASWLATRLHWIGKQEWIGDFASEIRRLRGRARALLDPIRRTKFVVGQCVVVDCAGWLVADVIGNDDTLPSLIYCDTCGASWESREWIALGCLVKAARAEAA